MKRGDTLTSPDGRQWVVNSLTFDGKALLERLDRRPREHRLVWKDQAEVETWERPDPRGDEARHQARREHALTFAQGGEASHG